MRQITLGVVILSLLFLKIILSLQGFPSFMPDHLTRGVLYTMPITPNQLARVSRTLMERQPGRYAFYTKLLYPSFHNRPIELWTDAQFPGASLAKFFIVAATFDAIEKGNLALSQPVSVSKGMQVNGNYGTGILRFRLGFTNPYTSKYYAPKDLYNENPEDSMVLSLGDLLYLSIRYSDNIAILGVADTVGRDNIQEYVANLGLTKTSILRYNEKGETLRPNLTTAHDVGVFLEKLYQKKIIPHYASLFLSWLGQTEESDRIVYPLPPWTKVLHKTAESSQDGVYHDAGIVMTPQGTATILVVLSQQPVGTTGEFAAIQVSVIRALSRLTYNHMLAEEQIFFFPYLPGIRSSLDRLFGY